MKNICFPLALVLLFASSSYAQQRQLSLDTPQSEQRVALVIGNSAYEIAPLKNPVNDAQDMAQALRELGFEVIYRENLDQNSMKRAIRAFGEKIHQGGVGLFYYAGHGVQVKGENYLVPIGAKVESEEEVEYEGINAGFVLAQMESARNNINIVILDACRNNPFARSFRSESRGLAVMNARSGTLIAYATAPGSVASDGSTRNGVYTQELLKFMRTPNLGIEEMFKQVRISVRNLTQGRQTPWESSSLVRDFYFAGTSSRHFSVPSCNRATLNGYVQTNGEETLAWFEWGETPELGNVTIKQRFTSDTAYHQALVGLKENATYYFRGMVSNINGTAEGRVYSFKTARC